MTGRPNVIDEVAKAMVRLKGDVLEQTKPWAAMTKLERNTWRALAREAIAAYKRATEMEEV